MPPLQEKMTASWREVAVVKEVTSAIKQNQHSQFQYRQVKQSCNVLVHVAGPILFP
ncbi:hypothetical protein J6590_080497 [Homalodisca vitripennis]|nr:hypothetical protein J6590_080497 [Homalodisca vitripennis]